MPVRSRALYHVLECGREKKERFAVLTVASSLTGEMCVFRINREGERKASLGNAEYGLSKTDNFVF